MHPIGTYRSLACQELAEKVNRGEAWRSLDVTINIDQMLQGSRAGIAKEILGALQELQPFILYTEPDTYSMILPKQMLIINIVRNTEHSRTAATTDKEFANNLRLAIASYTKFFAMQTQIEGSDKKLLEDSI
jgi:hypothetical protein